MSADTDLRRELGFWQALTIGVGTMIGAGIFLLVGVAVDLAGPAAALSYVIAGVVSLLTAASTAELATGMPRSGGDYYFVSRSLGPLWGAASGIGIWLSLTVAIAFYLVGMGEFLAQLLPVPPLVGAAIAIVALTALNVVGAKESGGTQVIIVLTLLAVLAGFTALGLVNVELVNYRPFLPHGATPIMGTTALVFVSFLGFTGIAVVAEEIEDPDRNLPRTLMGSVVLVTALYLLILLVVAGVFTQTEIGAVRDPLTEAARSMLGSVGGLAIIAAGLLATLSSANASIMASSRVNLAMSRDRLFPRWLAVIHERLLTPHRAIVLTGLLALGFLAVESLEELAQLASSLQLLSYTLLNVGALVLRAAKPEWYRPTFRTPGFPAVPLIAALACIVIIGYSGLAAQVAVLALIVFAAVLYVTYARRKVQLDHAMPALRERMAEEGVGALVRPPERPARPQPLGMLTGERVLSPDSPRAVAVALANPETEAALLRLARYLATGAETGGRIHGIHLVSVPRQTPLAAARSQFEEQGTIEHEIAEAGGERGDVRTERPLDDTTVEAVTDVTHDVFGALVAITSERNADLLTMGWQGGFSVGRIYNSPVQRVMANVQADLVVLKDRGLERVRSILLPWGGGVHARLGLELAIRIGAATGASVEMLRVLPEDADAAADEAAVREATRIIRGSFERLEHHAVHGESVTEAIQQRMADAPPDLVVIGASRESRIRNVLFGSIPDIVADSAPCSVVMVHRYLPGQRPHDAPGR